jgi:mannose-6-phosphate isomerase
MSDEFDLALVRQRTKSFFDWLSARSLPLWSTVGVDRQNGGFIEQLTSDGAIIADVRRARLVARQIFAFSVAGELGWSGPIDELVDHGLSALLRYHLTPQAAVIPRFIPCEQRGEGDFDLYDQAFVLFGLASAYAHSRNQSLEFLALHIVTNMREGFSHDGGFAEHKPAQAPLKANPHMHMLEAALAWTEKSKDQSWRLLAQEIVDLCLARFIDSKKGSLHEFFDTDWSPLKGEADVVEPGHQVEWAWLLMRAERFTGSPVEAVAERLFEIAEHEGLDDRQQRLINELNPDLSPRDTRLRLWPQTERIKALTTFYRREPSRARRQVLSESLAASIEALLGYFEHPIAGAWWEHFDFNGRPLPEPSRASSLYHIMGAASELARLTGMNLS